MLNIVKSDHHPVTMDLSMFFAGSVSSVHMDCWPLPGPVWRTSLVISYLNKTIVPCAYICARGFANKEQTLCTVQGLKREKNYKTEHQKSWIACKSHGPWCLQTYFFFLQLDSEFYNEPMFARQTAKLATLITLPLTMIHGRNGHFYHK